MVPKFPKLLKAVYSNVCRSNMFLLALLVFSWAPGDRFVLVLFERNRCSIQITGF